MTNKTTPQLTQATELAPVNPYRNAISIEIKGCAGAGKTTLMHLLTKFLTEHGQQVECFDWNDSVWGSNGKRDVKNTRDYLGTDYFASDDVLQPAICSPILITASNTELSEISDFFIRHNFTDVRGGFLGKLGS